MEPATDPESLAPIVATGDSKSGTQGIEARSSARLSNVQGDERDPELPLLYCPVCSLRLDSRKCKLYCGRCGYYMSCADYY